jgi:hypothetical protein
MDKPDLSVIVAVVGDTLAPPDTLHLGPCLAALTRQAGAGTVEIVVPYLPSTAGIERLRRQYTGVRFVETPDLRTYRGEGGSREHHDELRARGLAIARGRILALTEDHGIPGPDWCAQIVAGHREPIAGLCGAIENGVDRPLNWAVYFCDFLRYQNPLPRGEATNASDVNVSYSRAALETIRPVWQETFHETSVNAALCARGEKLAFAPGMVIYQHRQGLRLLSALQERFVWGRSYAGTRARLADLPHRLFWTLFAPLLPFLLTLRMARMAWQKRRTRGAFLKALPLTFALEVSWSCGEFVGYITARANAAGAQTAEALARALGADR